jgi:NADPH-dependent stearoyl-CoA 9-desaturase
LARTRRTRAGGGRSNGPVRQRHKVAWGVGTAMLAVAKIIVNMELGHKFTHGQWDLMNDPEIHSTEWEWDTTSPSVHWKKSHNFIHHEYTTSSASTTTSVMATCVSPVISTGSGG